MTEEFKYFKKVTADGVVKYYARVEFKEKCFFGLITYTSTYQLCKTTNCYYLLNGSDYLADSFDSLEEVKKALVIALKNKKAEWLANTVVEYTQIQEQ